MTGVEMDSNLKNSGRFLLCVRVRCTTVEYAVKTSEVLHTTALLVSLFNAIYNDIYSGMIT